MSRRPTLVAFAVISALLLVIAPGAQALNASAQTTETVVGDSHTSAQDFEQGDLQNFTTAGSGDDATLTLESVGEEYGFEEQPADTGLPDGWTEKSAGGTTTYEVVTTPAYDGSQALSVNESGSGVAEIHPDTQPYGTAKTDPVTAALQAKGISGSHDVNLRLFENGTDIVQIGIHNGDLQYYDGSSWNLLDSDVDAGEWVEVTLSGFDPSTDTYDVSWSGASSGSQSGLSTTNDMDAGYTATTALASEDTGYFDFYQIGGGDIQSASYTSAVLNVTDSEQAAINVTEYADVSVDAVVQTESGTTLNQTVVSGTGNHTLDLAGSSSSQLQVLYDVDVTGDNPEFSVGDESILFTNHKPNASNLSPADGAELTQESVEFSADISDAEFPTAQGDSVTAELVVDNQSVGSTTVTSNQTVTLTHNITEGGSHTYYWRLTDSYGATTTTAERTLSTPTELRVYNVSAGPSNDLVDNATIEVRMYQDGTIYTRETTDGTVSLSGVSPTEPFVVVANAPGYYDRRIFVRSLYEQQNLYLLPDSETGVDTIFKLQEYTGQYQQDDTILEVEREINGTWTTALGDYFGANGQFPATLEYNTRYRLRITNIKTGDSRLLGTFTPISSGTQNVVVSPRGIVNLSGIDATWEYLETTSLPAKSSVPFNASLDTGETNVTSWNISVVSTVNGTTTTLYSASSENVSGKSVSTTLNLSGMAGGDVNVVASYETPNGRVSETRAYTVYEVFENDNGLLVLLAQFVTQVPEDNRGEFTTFLAMMLTVLLTAGVLRSVPMTPEYAGIVAWLFVTAFGIIGWVSYEMVFIAGIGAVSFGYLGRAI